MLRAMKRLPCLTTPARAGLVVSVVLTLVAGLGGPAPARAADPVEFTVGEFAFSRPGGWRWVPASSAMRKAQLAHTSPTGEVADTIFFHFGPGQGGGVQANVDRWLAQFQNPRDQKSERIEGAGGPVTIVQTRGTFLSGMPGTPSTPMDGFALMGAILESPSGDVYVKMTGPAGAVEEAGPAFRKMVAEARKAAASALNE